MSLRFTVQFIAALLLLAGAVGMLVTAIQIQGFNGAAMYSAVVAAIMIGIGILFALDALAYLHPDDEEAPHADHY